MPSPFQGIETASRALQSFQQSLDTTSNNIANVNSPSYSRQVVNLQATPSYISGNLSIGSGVNVTQINRIRDAMLQNRQQDAYSQQGQAEGSLSNLEKVQSMFLDASGSGISNSLSNFFNSWSALGSNPTSAANLQQVQSAGRTLASQISGTYSQLKDQSTSQTTQINQTISDIQTLAGKIDTLNSQIRKETAGGTSANDLLDQRDQAISDLSKLVNVTTHQTSDGSITVAVGSFTLVDQVGAKQFPNSFNAASSTVTNSVGSWGISSGKLKGLFDNANQTAGYMSQLDNLANTLRTQVNSISTAGFTSAGTTGVQFFNDSNPQTGAIDFALSAAVDSSASNVVVGNSSAAGDGSAALALSNLQNTQLAGLGNQTFGGYYNTLVSTIGRDTNVAQNNVDTANGLSEQVDSQVQSTSGVNIDDEMSNMLKFQRSYQAAAKVLNTMDQVTSDLINMITH